jgi:hypothetical protein
MDVMITGRNMKQMEAIQTKTDVLIRDLLDDPRAKYLGVAENAVKFRTLSPRVMDVDPAALDTSHLHACATDVKDKKNALIESAFAYAKEFAGQILDDAGNNNFDRISDSWNLDVGPDGTPTYTVELAFDEKGFSGTRNDLYIVLTNKKNQADTFQLIEETGVYKAMNMIKSENRAYRQFKWSGMRYMYYIYPEGPAGRGCADRQYGTSCPDPGLFRYNKSDLKGFRVYVKRRAFGDSKLVIASLAVYANGEKIFSLPKEVPVTLNARSREHNVSKFYPVELPGVSAKR